MRIAVEHMTPVFLLTDGHATWGESDFVSGKRVFAYTTGRAPRALPGSTSPR